MSWYNNEDNSFIDATQTFEGGSGNISGGSGTGTGADSQLSDVLELKLDYFENEYENPNPTLVYNLYLKNNNTGGEIRFLTKDAENNNDVSNNALKYNVKIGTDGKIYVYYTYNFLTSAVITSRWIEISDYIVGIRQGVDNNVSSIAGLGIVVAQNTTTITTQGGLITGLQTSVGNLTTSLSTTIAQVNTNTLNINAMRAQLDLDKLGRAIDNIQNNPALSIYRGNLTTATEAVLNNFSTGLTSAISASSVLKRLAYLGLTNNILAFVIGGGGLTGLAIASIYAIIDKEEKLAHEQTINENMRYLESYTNDPTQSVNDTIFLGGLQINQTTNNNFTTAGDYEEIDAGGGASINIKISGNPLIATITRVINCGSGFSVGNIITIPKSSIGGSTGNLEINVTAVQSRKDFHNDIIEESQNALIDIDNRNRRRQFIPDKNDFNNGLEVTETNVTEPSGEITKQLDISLKLDTSQFQYDATGNLQIQNYGTIPINAAQFQYVGGNLELINYNQIGQNATDISTIQSDISTIQGNISTIQADQALQNTNITNNYNDIYSILNTQIPSLQNSITTNLNNITTNTTDIATINATISALPTQGNLTEIYQLILNDGETPTSSTNQKQVNIGFNKNEFDSIVFDLIMGAVKVSASVDTPFTITDFNNFFFGLYPNMRRLNYHDVITLVKQETTKYYNDPNWNSGGLVTRGAFYFKNEKTGEVYDLNKRFEYLGFHRFKTNVAGENTYIIRTALEYDEQQDVPPYALLKAYQVDLNRLAFYLRDSRFYFSHLCRYTLDYWGINFTRNILTDFLAPGATYTNATPTYGNYEAYKRIFVVSQPNNEDIFYKIEDAYYPLSQTTFDSLVDTSTNSNPHFMGMLQNYDGTTYNHDPFGTLNTFIVSTNTLIHIGRIEIEYKIMRWEAFNSTWFDDIPNTQAKVANLWEELVFEFYDSYTDTVPAQTVLLDTRQVYTTSTNTIIIDFDKSPDLYSYLHKKWKIRPRFNSAYASGYPQTATNTTYKLTANQRSAFIVKVKLVPYVFKTLQREKVEEFTDGTQHTLSAFDYNKIYFYAQLNNNSATPFNDIFYKLNDNLDANKYQITIPQTFYTSQLSDLTDLPPNVTQLETNSFNFVTDDFFVSPSQQTITLDNSILIIGDEDLNVDQYQTHFNWRFLQATDIPLTETNLDDYDYLKTYNYYHQTAKCDRFFSCKEFYADVIDFKNIQVDGSLAYEEMNTSEFGTLSQASDGFTLKSLSSQNIQNLYGLTADGYVYYDTITGFTTNPIGITYGDADVRLLLSTSMGDTMRWDSTNNKIIAEPDMLSIKNRAFDIFGNDILRFTYTEPTASTYNITLDRQHKSNLSSNNRSIFSKTQFDEKEAIETFNFTESTPQFNSQGIGSGVSDSTGITFEWVSLGGDIVRYSGPSQRWGVYWTDDPRGLYGGDKTTMVIGDFTLLYMLNDGDDILCDPARYRIQSTSELWLIKDADIVEKIKLSIYFPDVYIHTFRTGYKISMEASDTAPNAISNVRDKVDLFYFNSSRVFHTAFEVADRSQYNPVPTLLEGVPVQYNNDYRWAWKVNQGHIMNLYEEGSLFMTGNIFVKCAVGINRVEKGNQILVNSIENLSKTNLTNTPITGIPPLVPQIFTFNIDNITTSGGLAILTISGTDRVATYSGVLSTNFTEFHIYNYDYIRITLSQPAINYLVNTFDCQIQIPYQTFDTFTLNQSTGLYEAFVSGNSGLPYIQHQIYSSVIAQGQSAIVGNLIYFQAVGLQDLIDIRLSNLQGSYTNTAYNPTDIFTLNYYPYNNDYGWALNTAGLGYTDQDVKNVLGLSGGNNITWNTTTEQFDLDSQVTTDITNNSTSITNLNNLIEDVSGSTKIKATNDIIFENNSIEKMRLDVNGNLGIGVNPPVEPIDFQHITTGWFKINNFGHLLMRNTQTPDRWNISIRNTGLFSISTYGAGGQYDNGVMPSQYNVLSILPSGNVGIGTNNPNYNLDVVGNLNTSDSITFGGSINTIPSSTFAYLANVTSDIQTQINNISSYTDADTRAVLSTSAGTDINWNSTTNQFDLNPQIQTDITTLNNLIYDDVATNTTYIDAITNFVVNLNGTQSLKCQNNLIEIRTPPTSTSIPFFRLVQALNNHQGQFYLSGAGNNDLIMDRNSQANNPNSGLALRVGGQDKIRIDGTGTIVIPNQIGTGNPTNSSYGLEIQHGTTAITGSGSFLMENGIFVVGSLTGAGNSIFDVNSSGGSFTRINPLGMFLIKNQNNANRYQIGIRNNGNLCIGNDTTTTSGTMAGSTDKLRITPTGEVVVRYNLKVGDANGALLTEISLLNLPTSQPTTANLIWRDSQGYLRIS
jgi:hypothetical protein